MPDRHNSKPNLFTRSLDYHLLQQEKYFTMVLIDDQHLDCKLMEVGQYELQVETEQGILLIPKHSIKYYILEEATPEHPKTLLLEKIAVNETLLRTRPRKEKYDAVHGFYKEHGYLDKPITVKASEKGWLLTDGFIRYVVARDLGLKEVPVQVQ